MGALHHHRETYKNHKNVLGGPVGLDILTPFTGII